MTVAAVAAKSTVLWRDCLSVATRGTETCAVPTVRDDGIEFVTLVKPSVLEANVNEILQARVPWQGFEFKFPGVSTHPARIPYLGLDRDK